MRLTVVFALAALFLLLPQLAHSDVTAFKDYYGGQFRGQLEKWEVMAITAIMICVLFNALVYMAGRALESENLKRYAKAEFLQVTASTMMIFFAVDLLYAMSTGNGAAGTAMDFMGQVIGANSAVACGAPGIAGGTFYVWNTQSEFGPGPLGAFKCKMQEKITALDDAYEHIYKANLPNERFTSTCIILFGIPVYCGDWDKALHNEVEEAHLLATKIVGLLMPLHGLYVLATYIQNNMLSVFLPIGLVLRIFPLTRGLGGLLIAIAIGFFFVWPTFFVLTDSTFVKAEASEGPSQERQEGACFTGFKGTAIILQNVIGDSFGGAAAGETLALDNGKLLLFQLTISVMFYPFVSLVITLIFIRAMTPLLGGDMGELMKMVARLG